MFRWPNDWKIPLKKPPKIQCNSMEKWLIKCNNLTPYCKDLIICLFSGDRFTCLKCKLAQNLKFVVLVSFSCVFLQTLSGFWTILSDIANGKHIFLLALIDLIWVLFLTLNSNFWFSKRCSYWCSYWLMLRPNSFQNSH